MPVLPEAARSPYPRQQPSVADRQTMAAEQEAGVGGGAEDDPVFDQFVLNMQRAALDENGEVKAEVAATLARPIQDGKQPAEALGHAAATVTAHVAKSAVGNEVPISGPEHVNPGLLYAVQMLAEIAQQEGIHDFSEDEMQSAATIGGELVFQLTQDAGVWDDAEIQSDFQGIVEASQSGEFDQEMQSLMQEGGPGAAAGMEGAPVG